MGQEATYFVSGFSADRERPGAARDLRPRTATQAPLGLRSSQVSQRETSRKAIHWPAAE